MSLFVNYCRWIESDCVALGNLSQAWPWVQCNLISKIQSKNADFCRVQVANRENMTISKTYLCAWRSHLPQPEIQFLNICIKLLLLIRFLQMLTLLIGLLYQVFPLLLKFGDSLFHNLLTSGTFALLNETYVNKKHEQFDDHFLEL